MKNPTSRTLASLLIALPLGLVLASWASSRDGQQEEGRQGRQQGGQMVYKPKGRGKKMEQVKQVLPTLKTSLAEGILLAEKAAHGKCFSASLEFRGEKPYLMMNLVVAEGRPAIVNVDPETKKVTIVGKQDGADPGAAEDADSEAEEHGHGDGDGDDDDEHGHDGDGHGDEPAPKEAR